ncbi:MAG: DNA primase [Bacillota bacterium]
MQENHDSVIDEILYKTDIVELISEVTKLEKKGQNYFGLCPFHHEKTPSFSVSEDKQLYHCFSCKASGNAITFVKETQNVSNSEAIKRLAERAGIKLNPSQFTSPNQKYYTINQDAAAFFKVTLTHTKLGQDALEYLTRRGITQDTIDTFDIGYAPRKNTSLYTAMQNKDHLKSDLLDLGLIKESNDVYDMFTDRIMFPLHDQEGRVVGFSGRIYKAHDKMAKYMNTPATKVFEKSKILYNMHRAKQAIKQHKRVVIFEGFMDVIKAHQVGIAEGVAVMGTALTDHHIKQLKSLTNHVILCFDGDQAGKDATRKFIDDLSRYNLNVHVVSLPNNQDPDDFISNNQPSAFVSLINNADDAISYLYNYHKDHVNLTQITDVERFKKHVFTLIDPLSNVEKNHFIEKLSTDLNTSKELIESDFNALKRKHIPTYRKIKTIEITDKFKKAERGLIQYFIKEEFFIKKFRLDFKDAMFSDKHARDLQLEIFEYYDLHPSSCIVPALFMNRLSESLKAYFKRFIDTLDYPYDGKEFDDYLKVMREQTKRNKIDRLKKKKSTATTIEEKIHLQQQIDQLNKEAKHGKKQNNPRAY